MKKIFLNSIFIIGVFFINITFSDSSITPHVLLTSSLKWQPIPGMPQGALYTVIDGDPNLQDTFVIRVKLPANYYMPTHSHRINEYYTIISGTYHLGISKEATFSNSLVLPEGSFIKIPALLAHSGWTESETVIQIQGIGPHGLDYKKNPKQLKKTLLP